VLWYAITAECISYALDGNTSGLGADADSIASVWEKSLCPTQCAGYQSKPADAGVDERFCGMDV